MVVVDEFQDLTLEKALAQGFYDAVKRLGAKARAAGVHLVLAEADFDGHRGIRFEMVSIIPNLAGDAPRFLSGFYVPFGSDSLEISCNFPADDRHRARRDLGAVVRSLGPGPA